ncbi:MAG: 16S rRNA (guanine(966)-N(2))-methyltransferase RsmD [bacterium]|nr:16S rRNA (guanine(966)-N(2))-methyltransferase RsmD [bacterium]MDE0437149.1 16S rRNA (guanine(966)-N(2))-methyltransferase RsmD [bacterium]
MRVISGVSKGRRLKAPRGRVTRPMTDRAREGIFSAIAAVLPGADVLDLYAGTGSLGLEALSRGSASVVFVENDRRALQALRANVDSVGLGGEIAAVDVDRFLTRPPGRFDLVFVDPPYHHSAASVETTLRSVVPLMRIGGTAVLHRPDGERRPEAPGLEAAGRLGYGTARIWRYLRVPEVGNRWTTG